jgi:uncharacterized protein with ParB-like and HNH nuclease domain
MNILKEITANLRGKEKIKLIKLMFGDTTNNFTTRVKSLELSNRLGNYLDKRVDKKVQVIFENDQIEITGYCTDDENDYSFAVVTDFKGDVFSKKFRSLGSEY